MPNHCSNTIRVNNVTSEQAQRILDAVEREALANEFMPQPDWKSTPNEDGIYPGPEYYDRHGRGNLWSGGPLRIISSHFPNGDHDQRWYGWNNTNWGTKWGMYDMDVDYDEKEQTIFITGQTAWSPLSLQWFEEFSRQLPGAEIICGFSETGCDFYGVTLAQDGSAVEACEEFSSLKESWVEKNISPEKLAIYKDEDHEQWEEVDDEIRDEWWDNEYDALEPAQAIMLERLREEFRDTTSELKGDALIAELKKMDFSHQDLKDDRKFIEAAINCGYVPQNLCATEELSLQREQALKKCLSRFATAIQSTHWFITLSTEQTMKGLGLK